MVKEYVIKNMVCDRCIKVLREELHHHNIEVVEIELGYLKLNVSFKQIAELERIVEKNGFGVVISEEEKISERVKVILINLIRVLPVELNRNLSAYLAEQLGYEYSKISKVFSTTEGITIEKYFIRLKIERVKELIQAEEHNFTQMAQLLDYSHINHLSAQFKRETGMSLSEYKSQHKNFRSALDKIM